MTTGDVKAV